MDVSSGKPETSLFRRVEIEGYNADDYVMKQLFVTSKDGTQVTHTCPLTRAARPTQCPAPPPSIPGQLPPSKRHPDA